MFKTILYLILACAFFNVLASQNPCKPWLDAMEKACKVGMYNEVLLAHAQAKALNGGCTNVRLTYLNECKELLKQAEQKSKNK